MDRPIVKKGTGGDAAIASFDDRLAIHIRSGRENKKSSREYAVILANAFADRKYTDYPIYITVTHNDKVEFEKTKATIYIDGIRYRTKKGYNVFTVEQVAKSIKAICQRYVEMVGDRNIIEKNIVPNFIKVDN